VKDTSLTVPSGTYGIVMDVKVSFLAAKSSREKLTADGNKNVQLKTITEDNRKKKEGLTEQLTDSLSNILLGEKIPLDVVNAQTGEIIIPANRKITKTLLRKLANVYDHIEDRSLAHPEQDPRDHCLVRNTSLPSSSWSGNARWTGWRAATISIPVSLSR